MDQRSWVYITLVALTFYILTLLAFVPAIQTNELFKMLAVAIVSGAFCGGGVAFYFNTAKGSADKDTTIATLAASNDEATK